MSLTKTKFQKTKITFQEPNKILNSPTRDIPSSTTPPKSGIVLTYRRYRQGSIIQYSSLYKQNPNLLRGGLLVFLCRKLNQAEYLNEELRNKKRVVKHLSFSFQAPYISQSEMKWRIVVPYYYKKKVISFDSFLYASLLPYHSNSIKLKIDYFGSIGLFQIKKVILFYPE